MNYPEEEVTLSSGDKILIATDGIFEILGKDDAMLGIDQFIEWSHDLKDHPISSIVKHTVPTVRRLW